MEDRSRKIQNLTLRVFQVVGSDIVFENLEQFIGKYTKQIDLRRNARGIYFLQIENDDGIINKKLILK